MSKGVEYTQRQLGERWWNSEIAIGLLQDIETNQQKMNDRTLCNSSFSWRHL